MALVEAAEILFNIRHRVEPTLQYSPSQVQLGQRTFGDTLFIFILPRVIPLGNQIHDRLALILY